MSVLLSVVANATWTFARSGLVTTVTVDPIGLNGTPPSRTVPPACGNMASVTAPGPQVLASAAQLNGTSLSAKPARWKVSV